MNGKGVVVGLVVATVLLASVAGTASAVTSLTAVSADDVEIGQSSGQTQTVTFDIDLEDGNTTTVTVDTSGLGSTSTTISSADSATSPSSDVSVGNPTYSATNQEVTFDVSDATGTGTDPATATVTLTLTLDTSAQHTETGVQYTITESLDSNSDTVGFTLEDTTAPTFDSAVTGDSATGDSTATTKLTLEFTESGTGIDETTVDATDFTVSNPSVSTTGATVIGTNTVRLTVGSALATDATPDVTVAGSIADDAGNTLSSAGPVTATDGLSPVVSSAVYKDTNGDAVVDAVDVTYSESLSSPGYNDGEWSIPTAGTVSLSKDTTGSASGAVVTVDVTGAADTTGGSTAPELTYGGTSLVDAAGNLAPTETKTVSDGAAPVETSLEYRDPDGDGQVTDLVVGYSEDVSTSSPSTSDYALGGTDQGTVTLGSGATASGSTVTVDVNAPVDDTNFDLTLDYTGTSVVDGNGQTAGTFSGTSVADDAAPVATSATAKDTDSNDRIDRIDVGYTETLSGTAEAGDYALGGGDAGRVTLDSAGISGSTVQLGVTGPSGDTTLDLTASYTQGANTPDSVTDAASNPAPSFSGLAVGESVPPRVTAATTLDRDGDGNVDAATLTFSEAVDDSTVTASDYEIGGTAADTVRTLNTADDDTLQIRLSDGNEVSGTGVKDVTYTAGSTTDLAGNALAGVTSGDVSETDGASPVISSFSLTGDATDRELGVSFTASESLASARVDVRGAKSATISTFSRSGSTYAASVDISSNGEYTAELAAASDAAGNSATVGQTDTVQVNFFSSGGRRPTQSISGANVRVAVSGGETVRAAGVTFGGGASGTISVRERAAPTSPAPPGRIVAALDVTVPSTLESTRSRLQFAIDRARLNDAGVNPADLVVYRLHDGEWQPLRTSVVRTDDDVVVISADTPGFSTFAIATADDSGTATPTSTPMATPTPAAGDDGGESAGTTAAAGESGSDGGADTETTSTSTPGLTALTALFALVVVAAALRRTRR